MKLILQKLLQFWVILSHKINFYKGINSIKLPSTCIFNEYGWTIGYSIKILYCSTSQGHTQYATICNNISTVLLVKYPYYMKLIFDKRATYMHTLLNII